MKLLALATPLLVLGLILLLQRMEAWHERVPTQAGRRAGYPTDRRISPTTQRRTMSHSIARAPATVARKGVKPLLRDTPAPPGYVDPLKGNATLEGVVQGTGRAKKSSGGQPTYTG